MFFKTQKLSLQNKKDATIPSEILVHKFENGDNIVVNSYIPFGNNWNMVQHKRNRKFFGDFNNDEVCFVLWGVLREFKMILVIEFDRNRQFDEE
jgi:hypothetical protein